MGVSLMMHGAVSDKTGLSGGSHGAFKSTEGSSSDTFPQLVQSPYSQSTGHISIWQIVHCWNEVEDCKVKP